MVQEGPIKYIANKNQSLAFFLGHSWASQYLLLRMWLGSHLKKNGNGIVSNESRASIKTYGKILPGCPLGDSFYRWDMSGLLCGAAITTTTHFSRPFCLCDKSSLHSSVVQQCTWRKLCGSSLSPRHIVYNNISSHSSCRGSSLLPLLSSFGQFLLLLLVYASLCRKWEMSLQIFNLTLHVGLFYMFCMYKKAGGICLF